MTPYELNINIAEKFWYKEYYHHAIEYYQKALKEKQAGPVSKKGVLENIEELKAKLEINDKL